MANTPEYEYPRIPVGNEYESNTNTVIPEIFEYEYTDLFVFVLGAG